MEQAFACGLPVTFDSFFAMLETAVVAAMHKVGGHDIPCPTVGISQECLDWSKDLGIADVRYVF
jgi:hypothetical protein